MTKLGNLFKGDKVIWIVYFFLCIISLVEVYSAGSQLAYKTGDFYRPLFTQGAMLSLGMVVVFVFHRIPCNYFRVLTLLYPIILLALILVLVIGTKENDGSRWLPIGSFHFQPSEVAKGILIITVSLMLAVSQRENGADGKIFNWIVGATAGVCIFILPENFSTAGLVALVVLLMMFVGRVSIAKIGGLIGVLAVVGSLGVALLLATPEDSAILGDDSPLHRAKTWKHRAEKFFVKEAYVPPEAYDIDKDAQVAHANIAIASSNFVGKMPGNSEQRDFLSQAFSDFIYAIIIEETGLWGGAFVIMLYLVLLYRASQIAKRCKGSFPAFLILGLSLMMAVQAFVNMSVAVGLLPVTGQTLPLISRGGTSILCCSWFIGMMLSVSIYAQKCELKRMQASGDSQPETKNITEYDEPDATSKQTD